MLNEECVGWTRQQAAAQNQTQTWFFTCAAAAAVTHDSICTWNPTRLDKVYNFCPLVFALAAHSRCVCVCQTSLALELLDFVGEFGHFV